MSTDILIRATARVVHTSPFMGDMVVEVTATEFYEMIHEIENLRDERLWSIIRRRVVKFFVR